MTTRAFLTTIFGEKRANDHVLIWVKDKPKGGTSHWFTDLEDAANFAQAQAAKLNVFFGIGLSAQALGASKRAKEEDVCALPGLWCEVDYKSDTAHKKKNIPPTKEDALTLINAMPFPPSIIVHSGNGFHAYWLLKELWTLADAEDRTSAKSLNEKWQRLLKRNAADRGWDIDSTFDLARVYRLPGTKNHKDAANVKDVRTVQDDKDARYTREQLQAYLDDLAAPVEATHTKQQEAVKERMVEVGALDLDPNAEPPFSKFEMLRESAPQFKRTWDRKRKGIDQSASGHDLSLANFAVKAGWTDQEIVNLCIAWRRKHNEDLKLRQDYYTMTIAKARISETRPEIENVSYQDPLQSLRSSLKGTVRGNAQELPIKRIIKRGVIRSDYDIELNDGTIIKLGSSSNVLSPSKVQAAIMDGYDMVIQVFTKAKWQSIAQLICDAAVVVETSSEESETQGWLADFVIHCIRGGIVDVDNMKLRREAIDNLRYSEGGTGSGFKDKQGRLYIRLNALVRFVTLQYGARTTERDAANRLSRLGFESEQLSARSGKMVDKIRVWVSPENFIGVEDEDFHISYGSSEVPSIQ